MRARVVVISRLYSLGLSQVQHPSRSAAGAGRHNASLVLLRLAESAGIRWPENGWVHPSPPVNSIGECTREDRSLARRSKCGERSLRTTRFSLCAWVTRSIAASCHERIHRSYERWSVAESDPLLSCWFLVVPFCAVCVRSHEAELTLWFSSSCVEDGGGCQQKAVAAGGSWGWRRCCRGPVKRQRVESIDL